MAVKPIPEGYHSITPYMCIKGAAKAIDFYKRAFSATERMRITQPDGRVGHAELQIGDSVIMLSDEFREMGVRSPETMGGSPISVHLYVEDADATFAQAVAAGATVKRPIADQFYGDRLGGILDPFGYTWWISTHKEDVSVEEVEKRAALAGN
jgi:PhnB protein